MRLNERCDKKTAEKQKSEINRIMKDLSMHIMDIVQNSVRGKAHLVQVAIVEKGEDLIIHVEDDGTGMDAETLAKVSDPFYTSRTTRKVGLGIPLIKQNAEQTDGKLDLTSELGKGTILRAIFGRYHIDRPPMGDIPGTVAQLISGNSELDFVFSYEKDGETYHLDSREVKEILGDVDIRLPKVANFLKQMIDENLKEIKVEYN